MEKTDYNDKKYNIVLVIILFLQVVIITLIFNFKKEGYHSDELWNYGFANSSAGESIFSNDGEEININEWIDSDVLLQYLSVDKSEVLDYRSVFFNASKDFNPPLQYMLLHAVSSFNLNKWSKWYCFYINIISFILTQIFIFKILKLLLNDFAALSGAFFYGFCAGSCNITIFLRLYALGVLFSTAFLYYSIKYHKERNDKPSVNADVLKLLFITIMGALTLHQFLAYAFMVAFLYSCYYLAKKEYKNMFIFGGVCALGVMISFAVFPIALKHLESYSSLYSSDRISVVYQFRSYISYVFMDLTGLFISLSPNKIQAVVPLLLGLIFLVFLMICLVCKQKEWVKKIKASLESYLIKLYEVVRTFGFDLLVLVFLFLFIAVICSYNSDIIVMGPYSRRYLFIVYPVFAVLLVVVIYLMGRAVNVNKKIKKMLFGIILSTFVLFSILFNDKGYLFSFKGDTKAFDTIEKNADCILVIRDIWISTCATNELYDTDMVYITNRDNHITDGYDELEKNDNPVYLLIDVTDEYKWKDEDDKDLARAKGFFVDKEEYLEYYESRKFADKLEYIGMDYLHNRKVEVWRLR